MASTDTVHMSRLSEDRMSLVTKIARLYHETGLRQPEIAERLHISQSRVSRLLKEAVSLGIVRTIVVPPAGVFPELEDAVRDRYHLADVVVVDPGTNDEWALLASLGAAGAAYLETTLTGAEQVGISSWSSTLLSTVDAMAPRTVRTADRVVQLIGGVGNAAVQVKATRLADRLARVTGAQPLYLPAPGIVATETARAALLQDPFIAEVAAAWTGLSVAVVGIGSLQPSPLLADSGNTVSEVDMALLRDAGAVGDVCLRFFDEEGTIVDTGLDQRVLGISTDELRAVPRRIGIAGGERKLAAIRAAVRGGWVNVLITDTKTAQELVK